MTIRRTLSIAAICFTSIVPLLPGQQEAGTPTLHVNARAAVVAVNQDGWVEGHVSRKVMAENSRAVSCGKPSIRF